jgi:hypothetical protein
MSIPVSNPPAHPPVVAVSSPQPAGPIEREQPALGAQIKTGRTIVVQFKLQSGRRSGWKTINGWALAGKRISEKMQICYLKIMNNCYVR